MTTKTIIIGIVILASAFIFAVVVGNHNAQLASILGLCVWAVIHFPFSGVIREKETVWTRTSNILCLTVSVFFVLGTSAILLRGVIDGDTVSIVIGSISTVFLILSIRHIMSDFRHQAHVWS